MKIEIDTNMTPKTKKILQVAVASILTIGVAIGTVKASIDARFVNESLNYDKITYITHMFGKQDYTFYKCGSEYAAVIIKYNKDYGFHSYHINAIDVENQQLVPIDYNATILNTKNKFVFQTKTEINGYTVEFKDDKIILNGAECSKGLDAEFESMRVYRNLKDMASDDAVNEGSRVSYQFTQRHY